ncbi:uncharacterized protein LOC131326706 [Rhododendron vialii]|uniref:uncharacterized protein LOC131326706 n=1 Tax=Rhododendron vialii TaxID=182163 RepID=UPI00265DF5AE|nr:uncharacterized protein LOC131326706 [Rhododendron vialii]
MTSTCISNCINDARVPVRATYVNLYKWPESDAEFVRTVSSGGSGDRRPRLHPRVADSISCRQLYLRSYTFSRKETVPERTKKCLARAKERVARAGRRGNGRVHQKRRMAVAGRRVKDVWCAALCAIFHRLLTCTASVDVVEHSDQ